MDDRDYPNKNVMMDRPIVQEDVLHFLRTKQRKFDGLVGELEDFANERRIPIIPHETAVFIDFLLRQIKPTYILEIGCAIGFSGLLMAQHLQPNGELHTIDRFDIMIERAKANFAKSAHAHQIKLYEGDAKDVLPTLTQTYDVIFMDSAKAKYYEFLPYCLDRLNVGGLLLVDDVFQAGTIFHDEKDIPKRQRKIYRELNKFMKEIYDNPTLRTTTLPLGDGLVMIEKLA